MVQRKQAKRGVWVYFYNDGARGFGHLGLIVEQKSGSLVRYSQGAVNPNTSCVRIVIFNQRAKVSKKVFPPNTSPRFIAQNAHIVQIPTCFPQIVEDRIERYIRHQEPYHSLKNNCAGFIAQCLNEVPDFQVKNRLFPFQLFKEIKLSVQYYTKNTS